MAVLFYSRLVLCSVCCSDGRWCRRLLREKFILSCMLYGWRVISVLLLSSFHALFIPTFMNLYSFYRFGSNTSAVFCCFFSFPFFFVVVVVVVGRLMLSLVNSFIHSSISLHRLLVKFIVIFISDMKICRWLPGPVLSLSTFTLYANNYLIKFVNYWNVISIK